jgi:hypothetical protein
MAAEARTDYYTGETFYNENMSFTSDIYDAIKAEDLPPLLRLSSYDKESQDDIIVYTWDKQSITQKQKIAMRKDNDFSYRQKALFKKVGSYNGDGGKINYIYKAINAWGDGKWANEFYAVPQKSVIDNGFIKIEDELKVTDAQIMSYFGVTDVTAPTEQISEVIEQPVVESVSEDKNFYIGEFSATYDKATNTYDLESPDGVMYEGLSEEQVMKFGTAMQNLDKYDKQIGDIITIENGKFRLLDVQEVEDAKEKLLTLFSQSGITTNAIASVSDEEGTWGETTVKIISLEELLDKYDNTDWKEEDNNDTCNPF